MVGTNGNTTFKCRECGEYDVDLTKRVRVCQDCKKNCDSCGETVNTGMDENGRAHSGDGPVYCWFCYSQ